MLQIRKLSTKTWKHIDTNDGAFILTKFYAKEEFNEFLIVESYGSKRRKYLINEIEVYDIGGTAETFANFEDLFLRLEALKYTGFYKDGDIDLDWGSIIGTLSDQTDLQNALDSKVDKVITIDVEKVYIKKADGTQDVKATSSFKDIIEGYFNGTNFYTDALFTNLITPESSKIYLNLAVTPATQYRWSGSAYVQIGGDNDLYPIKYWYQATGAGILQTYGTNAIFALGTQSDVVGIISYRKYLTTTALGNLAIVRENSFARINGNRGFYYEMRFKLENTASAPDWRGLFGFRTTNTPGNINPTDDNFPFLGIGADATDTNLFFMNRLSQFTPIVKVDTGILKSTTDELLLEIKRLNGTNSNELTLKNLSTGDTVTTVFDNANITTITNYVSNNTSAKAIGFSISRIRLNVSE